MTKRMPSNAGPGALDAEPLRYTFDDARRMLGLARSTFYERIARGRIRVTKDGRRVFVSRAEIARYLAALERARRVPGETDGSEGGAS